MRKIGTFAASFGLIFFGIWMIVAKNNPDLSMEIFKWWPVIIIILGIELLISVTGKNKGKPVGMNFWIIPVILMFLVVNIFQDATVKFKNITGEYFNFDNFINMFDGTDGNYKRIDGKIELPTSGRVLELTLNNGSVNIKKSINGKIKINAGVYVEKDAPKVSYDIKSTKQSDGYKIDINESYIKKVETDVYIPDGYNLKIDGSNLDIEQKEELLKSQIDVNCDNGDINLKGTIKSVVDCDNGSIDMVDVKDTSVNGDNISANFRGNVENINLEAHRASVDINNEICKKIIINIDHGKVDFKTNDNNIRAQIDLNQGTCSVNGEKVVNRGINKVIGRGSNTVKIILKQGTVNFSSQK